MEAFQTFGRKDSCKESFLLEVAWRQKKLTQLLAERFTSRYVAAHNHSIFNPVSSVTWGSRRSLFKKKKSYQHCTESSQVPALELLGICWRMPFLVSFWKEFCSKEEELRKCLELQNTLNHEIYNFLFRRGFTTAFSKHVTCTAHTRKCFHITLKVREHLSLNWELCL